MNAGRVHYARNGDVRLAYRVFGDSGPVLVWVPGWVVSNVDTVDSPESPYAHLIELMSLPAPAPRNLRIRAGIHAGECERRGEEWSGVAVHTGARIGALAGAGEVLSSRTVRDLSAGSGLIFESLGPQHLKGLAEEVEVYRVTRP